jgi:hypothetical protein
MLATFGDRPGERHSILSSAERLTGRLTDGAIQRSVRPSEASRLRVLAAYEGSAPATPSPVSRVEGRRTQAVFVSYRREDAPGVAGRLYGELVERLGEGRVLFDVGALSPGLDFVQEIEQTAGSAAVVLALIGPGWIDARDEKGRRRLDDSNDFVRRELATALIRGARVIPVLVDGAQMPPPEQLPDELRGLTQRQAAELSAENWRSDVERLASTIELVLAADRAAVTSLRQSSQSVLPGDDALDSLLQADARLRRVRWVAIVGIAAAVVSALVAIYLYSGY